MTTKSRFAMAALAALPLLAPAVGAQIIRRGGPPPAAYRSVELPSGSTEVPMVEEGGVVLEVRINSQGPYRFALDTGAGGGGRISTALVQKLGLKPAGEVVTGDPSGKNTQTLQIVEADTLTLGGAVFKGVKLMARDLPQPPGGPGAEFDGVLGIALFKDHLLTLDYPAKKVRIEAGEFISVLGPSGCGKSTLLKCIGGLETATTGDIRIGGSSLAGPPRDLGMVFQTDVLLDWLTIVENIMITAHFKRLDAVIIRKKALELLAHLAWTVSRIDIPGNCRAACANEQRSAGRWLTIPSCS